MQFYMAPLEGITGYLYRNAFHAMFDDTGYETGTACVDKYFAPFISPGNHKKLTAKENRDIDPANNQGIRLVPQILTNHALSFLRTTEHLLALGYQEVNINMGCPSGTVVSKHKGAGMLMDPRGLDLFLKEVFSQCEMQISIKTRIGMDECGEWKTLLGIFNSYPVQELIVHPRLGTQMYTGSTHLELFDETMDAARMPVCYNGDIFTQQDYEMICSRYPALDRMMLGRGLLTNPALLRQLLTGQPLARQEFLNFHDTLFHAYEAVMSGDRNLLFKMKELWNYWAYLFVDTKQILKKIRKTQTKQDYWLLVSNIIPHAQMTTQGYGYK